MVAINIRGTGGSGKSYLVHKLLDTYKHKRIVRKVEGKKPKIIAYYISEFHLYIIGSYKMLSGGCDAFGGKGRTLKTIETIEKYARKGNVLYEGYLVSRTWGRYKDLSDRLDNPLWIFLDTPVDVCLDRVLERRRAKGNLKPLNPSVKEHVDTTRKLCIGHQRHCKAAKIRYEMLNYKKAYKQFLEIIKRETNDNQYTRN